MTGNRIFSSVRFSFVILAMILSACAPGPAGGASLAEWLSLSPMTAEAAFEYVGTLDAVTGGSLVVDGRELTIGAQTSLSPDLAIGQLVAVQLVATPGGGLLAVTVEPSEGGSQFGKFVLTGSLTADTGAEWTVGGIQISLPEGTEVQAGVGMGSVVHVEGFIGPDGQLVVTDVSLAGGDDAEADEAETEDGNQGEVEDEGEDKDEADLNDEVDGCEAEGGDGVSAESHDQGSHGDSEESDSGDEVNSDDQDNQEHVSEAPQEIGCGEQNVDHGAGGEEAEDGED